MRTEKLAIPAVLAALFLVPDTAEAHGRLPAVTRISFGPDGTVLARASFGLLVSRDEGAKWDLVCGKAVGFDVIEDPVYAAGPDGALFATTANGLSISQDRACSWSRAGSATPFVDVTPDGRTALSSRYASSDGTSLRYETQVWRAGGATIGAIDRSIVPNSFVVSGSRIDIAAVRYDEKGSRAALVLTSRDDGATWTESPVTLVPGEERIAAVAGDGERLYLRTLAKGASRLLVHDQSGVRAVHEAPLGITAVTFSEGLGEVWVAAGDAGIAHASTKDFAFEKVSSLDASCLAADARGLWACGAQWKAGFLIGLSTDGGKTFAPRLSLCAIRGDLACTQGCAGEWEREKRELGCEAVVPSDEPSAVPAANADPPAPEAPPASASCSLRADRLADPSSIAAIAASVLLALLARGKRSDPRLAKRRASSERSEDDPGGRRVQSTHGGTELRDDQARRSSGVR